MHQEGVLSMPGSPAHGRTRKLSIPDQNIEVAVTRSLRTSPISGCDTIDLFQPFNQQLAKSHIDIADAQLVLFSAENTGDAENVLTVKDAGTTRPTRINGPPLRPGPVSGFIKSRFFRPAFWQDERSGLLPERNVGKRERLLLCDTIKQRFLKFQPHRRLKQFRFWRCSLFHQSLPIARKAP